MLNASPDGLLVIDSMEKITEVSEIGLQLLGSELREDIISRHITDFVPSEEQKVISAMIEKTINEGLTQNMEVIIRRKTRLSSPEK
ncbi:MAG: PAS domain S-box protein [Bacteroidales bacterium]|nr:PAS domain S-box protein [Bacteroidales bacterium]